jgi:hypothetical protein
MAGHLVRDLRVRSAAMPLTPREGRPMTPARPAGAATEKEKTSTENEKGMGALQLIGSLIDISPIGVYCADYSPATDRWNMGNSRTLIL